MRRFSFFLIAAALLFHPALSEAGDKAGQFKSAHGGFLALFNPDPSNLTLEYLIEPGTDEKDGPGSYDLQIFRAGAQAPFPLTDDIFLRLGLDYGVRNYHFNPSSAASIAPDTETLHKGVFSGSLGYFALENLLLMGGLSLGAYSDFEEKLEGGDIRVFGRGTAVYALSTRFQLVGGAAVSEDFEDVSVIPLLGFRWLSTGERVHLTATLPIEARVSYRFSQRAKVYAGGWISGDQYHVRLGPLNRELDIQVQDRRVGAGVLLRLNRHFHLQAEGGLSVKSQFEFQAGDAGQFEGEVERSGYGSIRIRAVL